jgi:hypothetical protein
MRPRPVEFIRCARDWLVPSVLLAVAPKCILCFAAYAGIGTALGLGGPELCGATESTPWTPVVLGAVGIAVFLLHRIVHQSRPSKHESSRPS